MVFATRHNKTVPYAEIEATITYKEETGHGQPRVLTDTRSLILILPCVESIEIKQVHLETSNYLKGMDFKTQLLTSTEGRDGLLSKKLWGYDQEKNAVLLPAPLRALPDVENRPKKRTACRSD
ncbi:uncharacterized protein N7496_005046 [Penicillium cataractarum]|uniref:Uncharacterized protein n=1 Tax=Penicillium cataractarum TaxID=2100454 RepID=A0A9W9VD67_9EURO|nr:uncharacterized protein N7496_005046 [Penicillium cataractarum]KAJ5377637.1 hypothetical protein N7496_005046 [Penicillium cataractarum]